MNLFQWVFVPLLVLSSALSLLRVLRGRVGRREGLAWAAGWGVAAALVADPGLSVRMGNLFGIGRGVDFVLYVSVIAGAYVALSLYGRSRRLEAALTEVVRQLAIEKACRGGDGPGASPA